MNRKTVILYGAYGYSGKLIAQKLLGSAIQFDLILAGRNKVKVDKMGRDLKTESRSFALERPEDVAAGLDGCDFLINAAGPFSQTAEPLLKSCIDLKCHYLDITGELEVFETIFSFDSELKRSQTLAMPGVGFDVVPSDCLAVELKSRLPDAQSLEMAFNPEGGASVGTLKTAIEMLGHGTAVRRDGKIIYGDAKVKRDIDSQHMNTAMSVSWGDVSTAFHSTGIPNITVFLASSDFQTSMSMFVSKFKVIFKRPRFIRISKKLVEKFIDGPTEEVREKSRCYFWGEVRSAKGESESFEFSTPNGYSLTASTAVKILEKLILAEELKGGFQTPGAYFGSQLIREIDGVEWPV
ncbi:saccharopine dehydrogenase NADP-binding domain-containing protein [Oligoflexaceae bacterium]|nr:saccharopine dehydrogenase NADP-binding domain-containing protein [Oligoflexaceae bacterium]